MRLLLIRHAKSSWSEPALADHDRPLNQRGERNVLTMSERLAIQEPSLEAAYSSTAVRAKALATMISHRIGCPLILDQHLYTFEPRALLHYLLQLPTPYQHLAIVGHNPAITTVVNQLSDMNIDNVPTAGVVAIDCDISQWQHLAQSIHRIDYVDYPKKEQP